MKSYSATRQCGAAVAAKPRAAFAIRIAAATALALMLVAGAAGTSLAQDKSKGDTSKGGSSWERTASVLVVPPVYRPESAEPADACAEDCPSMNSPNSLNSPDNPGMGESPIAVIGNADNPTNASAGTADNPTDESVAVGGSAPDLSGLQDGQVAAVDSQQSADSLDSSPGSAQSYRQQAAGQGPGNYGIGPVPYVVIGVPVGSSARAASAPASAPASVPARSFPTSPAWMPQPMPEVVPLPPMVAHVFQPTGGGFPVGVSGGFRGGLPQMPGFPAGFGNR
jgi:hypothetical protein